MNQITWQGKLRQLRGEFKREVGKLTHNDRQRIEGELDRMLGQMQQKYGYTRERAWQELERYWRDYGQLTQAAISATVGVGKKPKPLLRRIPWVTVAFALIAFVVVVAQLRWPGHTVAELRSPALSPTEKKRKESIRQEKERDLVDEQSWESFPASDPPASW
jgi:uncharacterized protein YjbJ (UPF0337 family)